MRYTNVSKKVKQSGVTLIEMTLAIIILSIVLSSVTSFLSSSTTAYIVVEKNLENNNKLNYAMTRITNELKSMNYDYTNSIFELANTSDDTRIEFDDASANTIIIAFSGGQLTISYSVPGPATAHTLVDSVSAFSFAYYQSDGTTTVDPTADPINTIVFIEFDITLTDDGINYHSKSRVALKEIE